MNIVYTSDDKFSPQIATGIASVIENNMEEDIVFYVISKGITDRNKKIIKKFVESYGKKIEFVEIIDIKDLCGTDIDTGSWNDIVLARLFLDRLLGNDVKKVLYLDGDTIVRGPLKELYNMDMKDAIIGAAIEPTTPAERKQVLAIEKNGNYYNAGVLLIDLEKWSESNTGKRIMDYFNEHNGHLFANDQDAINGCLKDEIIPISIGYNYCNTYNFYPYKAVRKMVGREDFYSKEEYTKIISNPTVVHFLGEERPWRHGSRHRFGEDFFLYYKKTPYGKSREKKYDIIEYGWEKYFFFFYAFNFMIKPFPMSRWRIMNLLIPKMIKYRKKS